MSWRTAFTSLLSILIIGQTELDPKLGEGDFDVREVVQRLEKRYLDPIDNDVEGYLRHKFERVGADYDKVMALDAAEAIVACLYVKSESRVGMFSARARCAIRQGLQLVPGATNLAHQGGEERVTGKLIAQVGSGGVTMRRYLLIIHMDDGSKGRLHGEWRSDWRPRAILLGPGATSWLQLRRYGINATKPS